MQKKTFYYDLSILPERAIDLSHFLKKIQNNGYSAFALDYELKDPKANVLFFHMKQTVKMSDIKIQGLSILKRVTLVIEQSISLHPLNQQQVPYDCDILAIRPLNQKMFHSICTEYDSYDVITFDISTKLPYMLKRNPVYQAIRRGKYFEICYDSMFDESKRVVAMTNMINIIKATNGKNLIVSSHASDTITHRTPYDVSALLISLGLDKNKALLAIRESCQEVIKNGQHRRYLKGAIQEIPPTIGIKLNKRIQKHKENIKSIYKKMTQNKMQEQKK